MQACAERAAGSGVAPGVWSAGPTPRNTTRKQHVEGRATRHAPGLARDAPIKAASAAPGTLDLLLLALALRPESGPASPGRPTSQARKKVTANESGRGAWRQCGPQRRAAGRSGRERTGATGLEPATSGVTGRCSAAQSPCKRVGWELARSLCRHLFAVRSRPLGAHAPQTRLLTASIHDSMAVIVLWGSDRLITAVGIHDRCPRARPAAAWRHSPVACA
jgi:hypothetical protein